MSNRVLVTGATGKVGVLTVKALQATGKATVRVFVRDADKARSTFGEHVEIAIGDFGDAKALGDALIGVDRLFLLAPSNPDQVSVETQTAKLAKAAGTKHLVKLSVHGADINEGTSTVMRWHAEAEAAVLSVGLPTTILRPNLFLQNGLNDDVVTVKSEGVIYKPGGNCRISHVDIRDIADMAATVLTSPLADHVGHTYYVDGPESLTYEELAAIATRQLGKPVRYQPLDDATFSSVLKQKQLPAYRRYMLVKLFQFYRTNRAAEVNEDFRIVTGTAPRSAAQYFADHKSYYI